MKKQIRTPLLVLLLVILVLSVIAGTGQVSAKYTTTITHKGTLHIKTSLAEDVQIQEHKANRQSDGSYKLSETELVKENSYTLIPGLDIPKDPFVTVTGKTPIDAFLFLEVVDDTKSSAISYTVDDEHWQKTNFTPKNKNGTVYLHIGTDDKPLILGKNTPDSYTVPILKNNTVEVSQKLLSNPVDETNPLEFYVYLIEKNTTASTPEQAYGGYPKP